MLTTILATVVVLGVLIFVHELGHFITAKMVDIEVPRFSIGLGPKAAGFQYGETEYVLSWLPLGGYVRMAGMREMEQLEGGEEARAEGAREHETEEVPTDAGLVEGTERTSTEPGPREFESKSLPARTLVISSGVLMNWIFAFFAFAAIAFVWGVAPVPDARIAVPEDAELPERLEALREVPTGAEIVAIGEDPVETAEELALDLYSAPTPVALHFADAPSVLIRLPEESRERDALVGLATWLDPVVGRVVEGSPAARAGLEPGDEIIAVAGEPIGPFRDLVAAIEARPGESVELTVARDGRRFTTTIVPDSVQVRTSAGERTVIGQIGVFPQYRRPGIIGSLAYGAEETWNATELVVGFLVGLFSGEYSMRDLGGPIAIGKMSGQTVRRGLRSFLAFMAIFSVNLAVLNLLPIPVLDGGHLFFLGIEGVRGRAVPVEQRVRWTQVGMAILLALMVFVIINDILRLMGI